MKRILAFAYACEPDSGSEPGAGWAWARLLTRFAEVHVITRENNRISIENALPECAEANRLTFHYVDLPSWARKWKRGSRGIHLYYILWMIMAWAKGRSLMRLQRFDLAWHLTFANVWMGTTASLLSIPFVLGPVGGGVGGPWPLVPSMDLAASVRETIRALVRQCARFFNPLARVAWARASVILAQNRETSDWLPQRHRHKVAIFPNPIIESADHLTRYTPPPRVAIFVGKLIQLKGVELAIRAIAETDDWRLIVMGTGPDKRRLAALADDLEVTDRIDFRGQVPRTAVLETMARESGVLLFPSLHEEAGWAVAEALTIGKAVICFSRGGPVTLAKACVGGSVLFVTLSNQTSSVANMAAALEQAEPGTPCGAFSVEATLDRLNRIVSEVMRGEDS